jgi:hypothetical protein
VVRVQPVRREEETAGPATDRIGLTLGAFGTILGVVGFFIMVTALANMR